MMELLRQAVENTAKEAEVEYSDQLVIDWMDEKVYKLESIKALYEATIDRIGIGTYDRKEYRYTEELELCAWTPTNLSEVHLYKGLSLLAKVSGTPIKTEVHTTETVCHYIIYKGIKFFEITRSGEALR